MHKPSGPGKHADKRKVTFSLTVGSGDSSCCEEVRKDGNKWSESLHKKKMKVFKKLTMEKFNPCLDLIDTPHG